MKVSSGLHRSPEGPQRCWTTEATPAFVQRTVLGTVLEGSLVHSGVKSANSQTSEGGVYHYLFGEKAVPRALRQIGGVPQIEYVYPDLLKRFKVPSADTYLQKSKPLKAVCKLEHLHKKKTFKTCISCRHWLLLFIHWLKPSTFFWKVWGYYFIAFVSNFRGRDSFLCFIIFKGAERTNKSELLIFFFKYVSIWVGIKYDKPGTEDRQLTKKCPQLLNDSYKQAMLERKCYH